MKLVVASLDAPNYLGRVGSRRSDPAAAIVHQALPAARSAKRVSSHPPLRATGQRRLQDQHRARQGTDDRPNTGGRSAGSARHNRSQRRYRSSPAVSLLRRPHDHCRGLCPRRRTARPALRCRDQDLRRDDYPCPLTAASVRRDISFPAPHPFHASAGKRRQHITYPASIRLPSVAAVLSPRSSAPSSSRRSSENHPPTNPLLRQIPIAGQLLAALPRVLSSEAFGRRPLHRVDRLRSAGIRNPYRKPPLAGPQAKGKARPQLSGTRCASKSRLRD